MVSNPHREPKIQFSTGNKREVLHSANWWTPTIIEGDVAFGVKGYILLLMMIRHYQAEYHEWMDAKKTDDEQKWVDLTSEIWQGLFETPSQ